MERTSSFDRAPVIGASASVVFCCAAAVSLAMSTQLLFQPFVWRNFPPGEIALAWGEIARDRVVVAAAIAAVLVTVGGLRPERASVRAAIVALAIVAGAIAGELLLLAFDTRGEPENPAAIAGRVVRWSIVGVAIAVTLNLWRAGAAAAAAAERERTLQARARATVVASDLDQLQRQIEPHFLFNTLATVQRLQRVGGDAGVALLDRLLDYMSAAFESAGARVSTLGRELELAEAYLDVCAARMGNRLAVALDVPARLRGASFPPLALATLVENAVKHGVGPQPEGGTIAISARSAAGWLEVSVSDDGAGLGATGGSGIGLANVAARLRLLYGHRATLRLHAAPRGVRATIRIPDAC